MSFKKEKFGWPTHLNILSTVLLRALEGVSQENLPKTSEIFKRFLILLDNYSTKSCSRKPVARNFFDFFQNRESFLDFFEFLENYLEHNLEFLKKNFAQNNLMIFRHTTL